MYGSLICVNMLNSWADLLAQSGYLSSIPTSGDHIAAILNG